MSPCTFHYDYMTRILFIFAKLNPKVSYVQGMNEILAPIFYLLNHSTPELQEAPCFFMFNNVMSDLLEMHMHDFADQHNPVHERLDMVDALLCVNITLDRPANQKLGSDSTNSR